MPLLFGQFHENIFLFSSFLPIRFHKNPCKVSVYRHLIM